MNIINRLVVGLTLASSVAIGLWTQSGLLLFLMTCVGIIYDMTITFSNVVFDLRSGCLELIIIPIFCTCNIIGAYLMLQLYQVHPEIIVMIIILASLSDILQCLIGKSVGIHYIGWVSPNKTWEGYIGGLLTLLILTCWIYNATDIIAVYIIGVIGGLISSSIKRFVGVKDFSKLLGNHGGLLDRADSIVLPGVIYYIIY